MARSSVFHMEHAQNNPEAPTLGLHMIRGTSEFQSRKHLQSTGLPRRLTRKEKRANQSLLDFGMV